MHDTLRYMAQDPVHRSFHHNEITFRTIYAFNENFVLPLSHDEVVHGKRSILGRMPATSVATVDARLERRALLVALGINAAFFVGEFIAGILARSLGLIADSLALVADAGHNLSDVAGLLLAWGAATLAKKRPSARRTYGYSRATIIASVLSGLILMGAVGAIAWRHHPRRLMLQIRYCSQHWKRWPQSAWTREDRRLPSLLAIKRHK